TFGAAPSLTAGRTRHTSSDPTCSLDVCSSDPTASICTVSGSTVTGVAVGSCVVAANQAGNTTYNAAPQVTQTITVGKGSQTITRSEERRVGKEGRGRVTATAR